MLTGTAPSNDRTMDSLDDLDRLLSNSADFTDFVTAPTLPPAYSQPKGLQGENNAGRLGTLRPDDTPDRDTALQGRKQRALDKSREAQKRFRQRQKVGVCRQLLKLLGCETQAFCRTTFAFAGQTRYHTVAAR